MVLMLKIVALFQIHRFSLVSGAHSLALCETLTAAGSAHEPFGILNSRCPLWLTGSFLMVSVTYLVESAYIWYIHHALVFIFLTTDCFAVIKLNTLHSGWGKREMTLWQCYALMEMLCTLHTLFPTEVVMD